MYTEKTKSIKIQVKKKLSNVSRHVCFNEKAFHNIFLLKTNIFNFQWHWIYTCFKLSVRFVYEIKNGMFFCLFVQSAILFRLHSKKYRRYFQGKRFPPLFRTFSIKFLSINSITTKYRSTVSFYRKFLNLFSFILSKRDSHVP